MNNFIHIFGNPFFWLMGNFFIVLRKYFIQAKQVGSSMTKSSDGIPNSNYFKLVEAKPEAKFGKNGSSHLLQAVERCVASNHNLRQYFDDGIRKDKNML